MNKINNYIKEYTVMLVDMLLAGALVVALSLCIGINRIIGEGENVNGK